MPTRFNTNFLRLKDDDEFEELLRDICALEWNDPGTERNGRSGQSQWGVDVFGQPAGLSGDYYGVQCKLRPSQKQLTKAQIQKEVSQAHDFPRQLIKLIIATDTPRDNQVQLLVDDISEFETNKGGFEVDIWFWPEIERKIATYPHILVKYYHAHLASLTNIDTLDRLVDRPLQVLSLNSPTQTNPTQLEHQMLYRGIQIADSILSPAEVKAVDFCDLLPDGLVCQITSNDEINSDSSLMRLASDILGIRKQVESTCPIFIVASPDSERQLLTYFRELQEDTDRYIFLSDDLDSNLITDRIFKDVFKFGYERRGTLPTINISARSRPNKPVRALLDLDWHSRLTTENHPTASEWNELFAPALRAVANRLTNLKESTQILIDSDLPVPASVALGFHLNLRVAILGAWARQLGKHDIRQLWLSDGEPANIKIIDIWIKEKENNTSTAILELTSGFSIHNTVKDFVDQNELSADVWIQIQLSPDESDTELAGINEASAIAYADHVGRIVRRLTERGITDTHLFLRLPTALGILVGQKLQACGRIHLYWFDNKSYSYKLAFMLA
jgi:hypothetical protein